MIQQYTYAHPVALVSIAASEDTALLTQWEAHLHPLQQAGLISIWSELHLAPGTYRVHELQRQVDSAAIVVLLLSADFFTSPDCFAMLGRILERAHEGTARVIPLLLRPVAWQESALTELEPWPPNGEPITLWTNQDAGWDVCVQSLRRLLGRRVSKALASEHPPLKHTDPDWDRMLRRLQRSYKELLDQSLHGIIWVELGLSAQPNMVSNVTNLLFRLSPGCERLLAPGTSILDAYDEAEGELLILGEPGAGKSTLLFDLAQRLVGRVLTDPFHPLPVILRLSSWALRQPALVEWMVEQLSQTYGISPLLGERWIAQGRLLPLLDGLDEMEEAARPACIATINSYHLTHLTPLVVCSRHVEYKTAAKRKRLTLQSAVIVQPLSDEQIEGYLHIVGPSFAGVRAALHQQKELWELATTPLMLSVLLLTYRGASLEDIVHQETELEQQVWMAYVKRMVDEKGNEELYPFERTRMWLTYLAQQLRAHQQTTFYAEHLHLDWLPDLQQLLVVRLAIRIPSIVIGVCVGLLVWIFLLQQFGGGTHPLELAVIGGFVAGCLSSSGAERSSEIGRRFQTRMAHRFCNAVLYTIFMMVIYICFRRIFFNGDREIGSWVRDSTILGLGLLLSGWVFQVLLDRPSKQWGSFPPEHLTLRSRLATSQHLLLAASTFGTGIGLSIILSFGLKHELGIKGLVFGLGEALTLGVSVSVIVILVRLILDTSLKTHQLVEHIHWTSRPLFRSAHLREAGTVAAMVVPYFALPFGLLFGLRNGVAFGLVSGFTTALFVVLGIALISGVKIWLSYWLLLGIYQSVKHEHLNEQDRQRLNPGIRRSLRNGFLISLIGAIIMSVIGVLPFSKYPYLGIGSMALVAGMVVIWTLFGGLTILRHYIIRWLLAHSRIFPWHASTFLDDATYRVLLRRVGGGYSFIHRRLQDYFVDAVVPPSQK